MSKQKKRIFKRSSELVHDLYKLEMAITVKPESQYSPEKKIEHVHHYHSVDSRGALQNTSIAVAGHFHVLEVVTPATDTDPAVLKCTPPMQWARVKNKLGQFEKKLQAAKDDLHTHAVTYIDSHKFVLAKINPEFAKFQATVATPPPSVDGIAG